MNKKRLLELAGIEESEGELLQRDKSSAANIARQLIRSAQEKLYKDGKKPTKQQVQQVAGQALDRFSASILKAMDEELKATGE